MGKWILKKKKNLELKIIAFIFFCVFKDFIYLLIFREGGEKERERNINVWLPLEHPLLGTWHTTQACALTGNQTGDPLVHRPALNPLSHTSQGSFSVLREKKCILHSASRKFRLEIDTWRPRKMIFFRKKSLNEKSCDYQAVYVPQDSNSISPTPNPFTTPI